MSCHTASLQVLTFESVKDLENGGKYTRLTEGEQVFDYEDHHAKSTKDGLYFSVKTYTGDSSQESGPGVLAGFSPDADRPQASEKIHAWRPVKVKAQPKPAIGF